MKKLFKLLFVFIVATLVVTSISSCGGTGAEGGSDTDTRVNPCTVCDMGEITETVITPATATEDGESKLNCSHCDYESTFTVEATKAVKLLVIGDLTMSDSISKLYEMLHGVGLTNSVIVTASYAYNKGASLDMHLENIKSNSAVYSMAVTRNSNTKYHFQKTLYDIIAMEEWDFIAFGQSMTLSGKAESYSCLEELIGYIKNAAPSHTKLLLHMP